MIVIYKFDDFYDFFQTAEQWQYVFIISSVIYLFGSLFYGIFASSELQPWAI